VMAHGDAR